MADTDTASSKEVTTRGGAPGPLQSERGTTTIADAVVEKVAGIATREVAGVHDLGGGAARAVGAMTQRVGIGDERTQGVSVEVGEREAAIDVVVVIEYGESIPKVSDSIRENVIKRLEGITGLQAAEVNITVNDLYFPGDEEQQE
ncbi:MAG: Asp23/Gls24 family envelope stress response protein [Thermoleophilaceae bacterium]|nr:Asp23/Gls24 family envelope stress response protein [Thermoleophilaceae bacterium]